MTPSALTRPLALAPFALGAVALVSILPASARAAPTRPDACLCGASAEADLSHADPASGTRACWSVEDAERRRCDLVLETPDGRDAAALPPLGSGLAGNAPAAARFMTERLSRFIALDAEGAGLDWVLQPRAQARARNLLERHAGLLAECLARFGDPVPGPGYHRESSEGLACAVGEGTGWLSVTLPVAGHWLTFMLAPPLAAAETASPAGEVGAVR